MNIEIEGTTPGVEQEKELSLSVEEQSSPESCKVWADADGLQPVTYIYTRFKFKLVSSYTLQTST